MHKAFARENKHRLLSFYAARADVNEPNFYFSGRTIYTLQESLKRVEAQWLGADLLKSWGGGKQALSKS
jgi:hypothetical protein